MSLLPYQLFRAEQVREVERIAASSLALSGSLLMERAGRAACDLLRGRWPHVRRVALFCGTGNNGGDGYVLARCLVEEGIEVELFSVGDPLQAKGEALEAVRSALALAIQPKEYDHQPLNGFDLLVDALLGTGARGELSLQLKRVIAAINGSGLPVLALDLPSGIDPDSGRVLGDAVHARVTHTFLGLKRGLFTGAASDYCGEVVFADLGLPAELLDQVGPAVERIDLTLPRRLLPRRTPASHKGLYGHLLVVGGDLGMAGAARLAAEAAARIGAGLVSIATRHSHLSLVGVGRPELMVHGVEGGDDLLPLLEKVSVVAVGPGLGSGAWGRSVLARLLESPLPLVVDADALNLLAREAARRDRWILTPHPGEAARLLGTSVAEIQADRFAAAAAVQASYGGVCVLKGNGTIVVDPVGRTSLCNLGNPGMASGGMGDLLTGVIGGLIAQGLSLPDAARGGVVLHAGAGDLAAAVEGERGMVASDLLPHLRRLANP